MTSNEFGVNRTTRNGTLQSQGTFSNNMSRMTTTGPGGPLGFTNCLKVIKEHLMEETHPIKILMKEFVNAFVYKNRHYLYTEEAAEKAAYATPDLKKKTKHSKHNSCHSFKKSNTESSRRSFDDRNAEMKKSLL